jgi:ABC-type transporter Mla subunit MlaD
MKCETTNAVLTFVLGVLVMLGVVFALQTVNHTRELRSLQMRLVGTQRSVNLLNLLLNDSVQYGKTHPDINPIIQPFETKPAAR